MKRVKRFIRVDFETGNHYQGVEDVVTGRKVNVLFKIDHSGVTILCEGISSFYPAGSYTFVTWE